VELWISLDQINDTGFIVEPEDQQIPIALADGQASMVVSEGRKD
jgi:hypothetical protein